MSLFGKDSHTQRHRRHLIDLIDEYRAGGLTGQRPLFGSGTIFRVAEKRSPNRTYKAHWCAMYFDETGRRRKLVARTKEEVEKKLKAKLPVRPEPKRRSFSNRSLAQLEELCESIGERARRGTGRNRTDE